MTELIFSEMAGFTNIEPISEISSIKVYTAVKDGKKQVIKFVKKDQDELVDILVERDVLRRAKGINGITHLLDVYENRDYFGLLKEYHPGNTLESRGRKIRIPGLYEQLAKTVHKLHARGIANLDLGWPTGPKNIVYNYQNNRAKLIDLVACSSTGVFTNTNSDEFLHAASTDLQNLRNLLL